MKFTRIQPICFCIHVGPNDDKKSYPGLDDPILDMEKRIWKAIGVFMQIKDKYAKPGFVPPEDNDVLKILVLPEFFFRGQNGGYEPETMKAFSKMFDAITGLGMFPNFHFFCGSVVEILSKNQHNIPIHVKNYVPAREGGDDINNIGVKPELSRFIIKEYKANNDFVWTKQANIVNASDATYSPSKYGVGRGCERHQTNEDGACIFEYDDITYGVELCLDHAKQRLRRSPIAKGNKMVQVQVIPSAGMHIKAESVVAQKGGIVINSDGISVATKQGETPFKDYNKKYHSAVAVVTKEAQGADPAELKFLDPIEIEPFATRFRKDTPTELYNSDYGELHFYPIIDLPEPIVSTADDPGDYWVEEG